MGLFSKKLDYEEASLRYEFDLSQDKYCFYKNGEIVEDKMLNGRSKRFLNKKNKLTEEEKEERREVARNVKLQKEEMAKVKECIEKRKEAGIDLKYNSFEVQSKEAPKLSDDVKAYLEELTNEEKNSEYVLGIHRIGPSEDHLENILNDGILVQGHMMGAAKGNPSLDNTVGYYPSNKTIISQVGFAYAYKNSKGSVVVKIPKEDIIANNIYVNDNESMYLNPKYIVGYFPVEEDKTVEKIVTKENIKEYKDIRNKEAEEYINLADKNKEEITKEIE